ncbi:MAG TPA: cohesin domain-containing protein [Candidatus Saccharimonadales bacterium]|jgi:hypothetical protein
MKISKRHIILSTVVVIAVAAGIGGWVQNSREKDQQERALGSVSSNQTLRDDTTSLSKQSGSTLKPVKPGIQPPVVPPPAPVTPTAPPAIPVGGIGLSPDAGTSSSGSTLSVTIYENSGTDIVNAAQASLRYDPAALEYLSVGASAAFDIAAATSTTTPGVINIARGTASKQLSGLQPVATVNFKVKPGSKGVTNLTLNPVESMVVRSSDTTNILKTFAPAKYEIK